MAQSNTVGGGGVITRTKRVFLTSGTALEGYGVCYNFDATDVNSENKAQTSPAVSAANFADARRVQVSLPNNKNNNHFAGVTSHKSAGVVGPNWIEIHEGDSICNVHAQATASAGIGANFNTGQRLTCYVGNHMGLGSNISPGKFVGGGFTGKGSAVVLQDVDRSSTSGLVMVQLEDGPQSGLIQSVQVSSTKSAATLGIISGVVAAGSAFMIGGVSLLTAINDFDVVATYTIPDGTFYGQRKSFYNNNVGTASVGVDIDGSLAIAVTSLEAGAAKYGLASTIGFATAVDQWATLRWNGVAWAVESNAICS